MRIEKFYWIFQEAQVDRKLIKIKSALSEEETFLCEFHYPLLETLNSRRWIFVHLIIIILFFIFYIDNKRSLKSIM